MDELQRPLTSIPTGHKYVPNGIYITFEGPEGSGKSTQVTLLTEYLAAQGYSVLRTKQPGGTDVGAAIRRILLHPDFKGKIAPHAESLLFWADRYQHHEDIVKPALASGTIVIGDRDFDSSWALQVYGRGIDEQWMHTIHNTVIGSFKPHKTILLMVPTKVMQARVAARNTATTVGTDESRFDSEQAAFHERVREGFLKRLDQEPERFIHVDGTQSVQEVHMHIRDQVEALINDYLHGSGN
jgi:dTMP kinase